MDIITSKLLNLSKIVEKDLLFNVPRYQRLYVWEEVQVKTFFIDIYTAFFAKKDAYYIGGVITVYNSSLKAFDLVDGQQRFTTLWLLANHLGGMLQEFAMSSDQLRLKFSIRENVEQYFSHLSYPTKETENQAFDDLTRISKARKSIENLIDEYLSDSQQRKAFIEYLYKQVKMVYTEVPITMDLNKLFETLNNRGVQLAQHEILKAKLLSTIKNKQERYRFGMIWNACSDMGNYLERAFSYELGNSRDLADSYNDGRHNWKDVVKALKQHKNTENKILHLQDILNANFEPFTTTSKGQFNAEFYHPETSDEEFEKVRSILTFPQLLLHTLRIFLFNNDWADLERINEKELLLTFATHLYGKLDEKLSRKFIELLLEVREVFDKYIIKWVEEEKNEEIHLIKIVRKQNQKKRGKRFYLRREKTKSMDGMALLQSMLYHSQQNTTQYWLTPYIYRLLKHPSFEHAYPLLKQLDNVLFSNLSAGDDLSVRSIACMETFPNFQPNLALLLDKKGTGFPHYWFYKMEYVLWHERTQFSKSKLWDDYRLTARNSVEHIAPQNPRDARDKACEKMLNSFGNLVLVSRSINSEYSDWSYLVKRSKFKNKKDKGDRNCLDSLKSDLIYSENELWNDHAAELHENKMLEILECYFYSTSLQH